MPHVLITGMTESGKSTLAKQLASEIRKQGRGVLVLDPLGNSVWDADYQTTNADEFLKVVWTSTGCDIFVDEAGDAIGHFDKLMAQLATRGRHFLPHPRKPGEFVGGHNCYFIVQRAHMISPTVRTQCRKLFAFNQDLEDCIALKKSWGKDELLECVNLPQGSYIYAERFSGIQRGKVF